MDRHIPEQTHGRIAIALNRKYRRERASERVLMRQCGLSSECDMAEPTTIVVCGVFGMNICEVWLCMVVCGGMTAWYVMR